MFSIDEFIIAVFCCVDELLEAVTQGYPICQKGFALALSDSEVITIEIVAEYGLVLATEKFWSLRLKSL
jgi:hypothetical protein